MVGNSYFGTKGLKRNFCKRNLVGANIIVALASLGPQLLHAGVKVVYARGAKNIN